jgi:hypothetical protein
LPTGVPSLSDTAILTWGLLSLRPRLSDGIALSHAAAVLSLYALSLALSDVEPLEYRVLNDLS